MSNNAPSRKSVDQLLSDFDNLGTAGKKPDAAGGAATKDAQSLLDDLDSLVQNTRAAPDTSVSSGTAPPVSPAKAASQTAPQLQSQASSATPASASAPSASTPDVDSRNAGAGSGWGSWGAVWSSAARLADQARAEIEKRAPPVLVPAENEKTAAPTEGASNTGERKADAGTQAAAAAAAAAQGVLGRGFKFAEGVRGYVKESGWDKIGEDISRVGRKGLNEIINAVAPPISAHEVLQVTLSHDMIGYDGIETVVFQVLAKVMEQVERSDIEHQLVVNKAHERPGGSAPKQSLDGVEHIERELNAVEGFEAAFKLAEAELSTLIKSRPPPSKEPIETKAAAPTAEGNAAPVEASPANLNPDAHLVGSGTIPTPAALQPASLTIPVTECPLYIRIQPLVTPLPGLTTSGPSEASSKHLFFVVLLQDPLHGLRHQVISQSVPYSWMDVPFDANAWVEQALVDVLQGALSAIGLDYVRNRSLSGEEASA
ncbi:hypothetical protein OC846_005063 [Tilletia horrida]|uniref:Maintenance of telomere capping protein 1 n=1 Tax=Tilletia horrida TaxID=155126 RepID=A0AAN6JQL3_9BASI|nr:hypothetical protein OC846_005063 [Tilletia horrida]KAK0562538.1 hypothetical protein OC861_005265 [Tilletia horrida]